MIRQVLGKILDWIRTFIREKFHTKNEDLPYYVSIAISAVLFIVAINGFVELTDELAEDELGPFDEAVAEYVVSFRSDALTGWFRFCTDLGDRYAYLVITILLAAYYYLRSRSWKFVLQTALVLILASLSNVILKQVINRARPELEHLVMVNTLSYPSGHSMSAMAFYGFLIYLSARYKMNKVLRFFVITILAVLILSVGISRIYLGVHFPSDVLAGFIGGLFWVAFCAIVFNIVSLWRKKKNATADQDLDT